MMLTSAPLSASICTSTSFSFTLTHLLVVLTLPICLTFFACDKCSAACPKNSSSELVDSPAYVVFFLLLLTLTLPGFCFLNLLLWDLHTTAKWFHLWHLLHFFPNAGQSFPFTCAPSNPQKPHFHGFIWYWDLLIAGTDCTRPAWSTCSVPISCIWRAISSVWLASVRNLVRSHVLLIALSINFLLSIYVRGFFHQMKSPNLHSFAFSLNLAAYTLIVSPTCGLIFKNK